MPLAAANGIDIEYESFGEPNNPAILLIMGLGTQMISWPLSLCNGLAAAGFRVIRFDNRDIGLSEKMENAHVPRAPGMLLRTTLGLPLKVSYTLDDMAEDVIGLMDALGLDQAHLVGASMGGMIGQIVTARHPRRVLSFTSIMSSSGDPRLPGAARKVVRTMVKRSLGIEKPNLENSMAFQRMIGSPGFPESDEELKRKVESVFEAHAIDFELDWHLSGEPFLTGPGKLIDAVSQAVTEQTGTAPELSTGGGTSDGRFISPMGADVVELAAKSPDVLIDDIDDELLTLITPLIQTFGDLFISLRF